MASQRSSITKFAFCTVLLSLENTVYNTFLEFPQARDTITETASCHPFQTFACHTVDSMHVSGLLECRVHGGIA